MEKTAATSAERVADYIIWYSQQHGDPITNLKLQKVLYYAQGWYIALNNRRLFRDRLEAWPRGPVQPSIWRKFSEYRWNPIARRVQRPPVSDDLADFLEEFMEVYGKYGALQLEQATHREPPWLNARQGLPPEARSNQEIDVEDMRRYFARMRDGKTR